MNQEAKWYLRTQDETFGPVTEEKLVTWAKLGRIQPGQEVSDDNVIWRKVEEVAILDMRFSIDIGDGNPRGPFNKAAAEALLASGRLPKTTTIVEVRPPFEETEPSSVPPPRSPDLSTTQVIEKVVEKVVEVPVEHVVEKVVEVPVDRVVEVPVDRVVEKVVEKVVVDDAKIKEIESENRLLKEQVVHLEDELRRLPAAASEVADIQAAVFGIMTDENQDLLELIETEKQEFEEMKRRHQERQDRLLERRRMLLKKSGGNIEEMTRRSLLERPEDPRTTQLRKEYDNLKREHEKAMLDNTVKLREMEEELRVRRAEEARMSESAKDLTQLRQETETLRARLQRTEQELMQEREKSEKMRQAAALRQQTMLARLASLESTSIGTPETLSTNQSREAKLVKLPSWMKINH